VYTIALAPIQHEQSRHAYPILDSHHTPHTERYTILLYCILHLSHIAISYILTHIHTYIIPNTLFSILYYCTYLLLYYYYILPPLSVVTFAILCLLYPFHTTSTHVGILHRRYSLHPTPHMLLLASPLPPSSSLAGYCPIPSWQVRPNMLVTVSSAPSRIR